MLDILGSGLTALFCMYLIKLTLVVFYLCRNKYPRVGSAFPSQDVALLFLYMLILVLLGFSVWYMSKP